MSIEQARQRAAERYPEAIVDTMGRKHPSVPRKAILDGHWDRGALVRGFMGRCDEAEGHR